MVPSRPITENALESLAAANVMIEGSIIGYESNVKSGVREHVTSVSVRIPQYQLDQIAVNLRVVNVSTGEVLSSVNTSKTILSYEVQAGYSASSITSVCWKVKSATPLTSRS